MPAIRNILFTGSRAKGGSPDTTSDGKQIFGMVGDSIFQGASEGTTNTPIPSAGIMFESTGSTLNAVDAAYIAANNIGRGMAPQFAIDYNSDTGKKVVICNGALSGSCFNNGTATLSWDTNGTLYAAFVTKMNNTLNLLGLTKPKVIFINLGINDGTLTLAQITSLIDRLRADYSGVPLVFSQIGDDSVPTNPVSKRALLKTAINSYSDVYIGANNAALFGAGEYQSGSPHPKQVGCNDQGHMFARWMKNTAYSKWAQSIISCHFDELSSARKTLIDNWVTTLGSLYFNLDECVLFKTSNSNNIFNDFSLLQEPQNPGAAVLTLNDSIATNGTTYFTLLKPQIAYTNGALGDCFHMAKVKNNSVSVGTLGYIFGGQFAGSQLIGIKQQVANNLVFSCVDANSGLTYGGQTSIQNSTAYTCSRNSTNEIAYVNGSQVATGAVGQQNTPVTVVLGGLNTANTFPTATLANGMTASFEYFVAGKQSTMNHTTLYNAMETLISNW